MKKVENVETVLYKKHPVYNLICGNNGTIYSLSSSKFINGRLSHNGYIRIPFGFNNKKMERFAHRLIIEAFRGTSKLIVNHIDGNKKNNSLINLEYVTLKQNSKHAVDLGLIKSGDNSPLTKIKGIDRDKIRKLRHSGSRIKDIAFTYGVTPTLICAICNKMDRRSKRDEV